MAPSSSSSSTSSTSNASNTSNTTNTTVGLNPTESSYIYNPSRPEEQKELENRIIARGWKFASKAVLGPHGKLQLHRHHGRNTHCFIEGSIKFTEIVKAAHGDTYWDVRPVDGALTGRREVVIPMRANVDYRAEAGAEGCVFVEAHEVLSPTTADRFASSERGTFLKLDDHEVFHPEVAEE